MYRGTLENGGVTQRQRGHTEGGKEFLTYDVWHCHPHDIEYNHGVRRTSSIHIYMLEPTGPDGKPINKVRVGVWAPGKVWQQMIGWGEELWFTVQGWGNPAIVSFDNVPLKVIWESAQGRA